MVFPDSNCWGYNDTVDDDKAFTHDGMMPKTIMSMVKRVTTAEAKRGIEIPKFMLARPFNNFLQ